MTELIVFKYSLIITRHLNLRINSSCLSLLVTGMMNARLRFCFGFMGNGGHEVDGKQLYVILVRYACLNSLYLYIYIQCNIHAQNRP